MNQSITIDSGYITDDMRADLDGVIRAIPATQLVSPDHEVPGMDPAVSIKAGKLRLYFFINGATTFVPRASMLTARSSKFSPLSA